MDANGSFFSLQNHVGYGSTVLIVEYGNITDYYTLSFLVRFGTRYRTNLLDNLLSNVSTFMKIDMKFVLHVPHEGCYIPVIF